MEIDYSQLQTYINCPKLYYNKYIRQVQKRKLDEGIQSRSFGRNIHTALKIWYENKNMDGAIEWFRANYQNMEGEMSRTIENGARMLYDFEPWWNKNFGDSKTLACEIKDSFMIDDIRYIVKIDRIIEKNKNIYPIDFKTTTKMTHTYFLNFSPNMQVSGYSDYCRRKYGQCSGFLPLAMQFGHRKKAYKGEPAGFWCRFNYDIVNRNTDQLEDFEKNIKDWTSCLKSNLQLNTFPKNESFCSSYYGCQYRELCISLDEQQIIDNLYEPKDPYEYLKEETDD